MELVEVRLSCPAGWAELDRLLVVAHRHEYVLGCVAVGDPLDVAGEPTGATPRQRLLAYEYTSPVAACFSLQGRLISAANGIVVSPCACLNTAAVDALVELAEEVGEDTKSTVALWRAPWGVPGQDTNLVTIHAVSPQVSVLITLSLMFLERCGEPEFRRAVMAEIDATRRRSTQSRGALTRFSALRGVLLAKVDGVDPGISLMAPFPT